MSEKVSVKPSEKVRQKTTAEYGQQVARISNKLINRAMAVDQDHTSGRRSDRSDQVHAGSTNVFGSTGLGADVLTAKVRTDDGETTTGIQRWRQRNSGRDAQPGAETGDITLTKFKTSDTGQVRLNRYNFVDGSSTNRHLRPVNPGNMRVDGMDAAVARTADTIAATREAVSLAEQRQREAQASGQDHNQAA